MPENLGYLFDDRPAARRHVAQARTIFDVPVVPVRDASRSRSPAATGFAQGQPFRGIDGATLAELTGIQTQSPRYPQATSVERARDSAFVFSDLRSASAERTQIARDVARFVEAPSDNDEADGSSSDDEKITEAPPRQPPAEDEPPQEPPPEEPPGVPPPEGVKCKCLSFDISPSPCELVRQEDGTGDGSCVVTLHTTPFIWELNSWRVTAEDDDGNPSGLITLGRWDGMTGGGTEWDSTPWDAHGSLLCGTSVQVTITPRMKMDGLENLPDDPMQIPRDFLEAWKDAPLVQEFGECWIVGYLNGEECGRHRVTVTPKPKPPEKKPEDEPECTCTLTCGNESDDDINVTGKEFTFLLTTDGEGNLVWKPGAIRFRIGLESDDPHKVWWRIYSHMMCLRFFYPVGSAECPGQATIMAIPTDVAKAALLKADTGRVWELVVAEVDGGTCGVIDVRFTKDDNLIVACTEMAEAELATTPRSGWPPASEEVTVQDASHWMSVPQEISLEWAEESLILGYIEYWNNKLGAGLRVPPGLHLQGGIFVSRVTTVRYEVQKFIHPETKATCYCAVGVELSIRYAPEAVLLNTLQLISTRKPVWERTISEAWRVIARKLLHSNDWARRCLQYFSERSAACFETELEAKSWIRTQLNGFHDSLGGFSNSIANGNGRVYSGGFGRLYACVTSSPADPYVVSNARGALDYEFAPPPFKQDGPVWVVQNDEFDSYKSLVRPIVDHIVGKAPPLSTIQPDRDMYSTGATFIWPGGVCTGPCCILIWVHGYNTSEAEARDNLSRIQDYYTLQGGCCLLVGYLWNGGDPPVGAALFPWAVTGATISGIKLTDLLIALKGHYPTTPISIAAHSLGCRVALTAAQFVRPDTVDKVILFNAAVDDNIFVPGIGEFSNVPSKVSDVHVLYDNNDEVLSKWYPIGDPPQQLGIRDRALGLWGPAGVIPPNVWPIDMTQEFAYTPDEELDETRHSALYVEDVSKGWFKRTFGLLVTGDRTYCRPIE